MDLNIQFDRSKLIKNVIVNKYRLHKGDGDMWPVTWAADGNLYGAAGDNQDSPMNFWKIVGHPGEREWGPPPFLFLVDNLPVDPRICCQRPGVHPKWGVKPASLISIGGRLYFAVELMNFGDKPELNRQHNICCKIMISDDYGRTWNMEATPWEFFSGRTASPHFLQFGRDYEGARDEYVYAYFPAAVDGNSYWESADHILLGRVNKKSILDRDAWDFFCGADSIGRPEWHKDDSKAKPVFNYPLMTGENHVTYNRGLKRYIMGNYGFTDEKGNPLPYHQTGKTWDPELQKSQLTLFESPEPWGPWSLFYQDDDWGTSGGYQPGFPAKWMSEDGKTMWMTYSGSDEDYNFTLQKLTLVLADGQTGDTAAENGRPFKE